MGTFLIEVLLKYSQTSYRLHYTPLLQHANEIHINVLLIVIDLLLPYQNVH